MVAVVLCGTACRKASSNPGDGAAAPSPVAVARVTRADLSREVVFDAEFRPAQDIDVHAKVAGFVARMEVDVGDRVSAGQLIATLEVPELNEEVERAAAVLKRAEQDAIKSREDARRAVADVTRFEADLVRAETAHSEATTTLKRFAEVASERPGLVAQQELDVYQAKERTAASQVEAARAALEGSRAAAASAQAAVLAAQEQVHITEAELKKLRTKSANTRITAPFSGLITKRYADVGDLVRGGLSPSAPAVPLVRLVSMDTLRLAFPISASFVSKVKPDDEVLIRVAGRKEPLPGRVARITREVEANTRTMEAQVDVPNPDGTLYPGMYGSVVMNLDRREKVLAVPLTALARGKKVTVFVVKPDNTLEEREVEIGLEAPAQAEVIRGVSEGDALLVGSRSQVKPGQRVEPKVVKPEEAP
jgi:RND family efflux transporter MFP subunit